MPELPEVETIRRDLQRDLVGRIIDRVEVLHTKSINGLPQEFSNRITGKKVTGFLRTGKLLQCALSSGEWLLIHLKMTGQLVVRASDGTISGGGHPTELITLPTKHTRIIFHLSGDTTLFFNDIRIFGWVHVVNEGQRQAYLTKLAPDAFLNELTAEHLDDYCNRHPNTGLKQMLFDQARFMAGIGNIYADEIAYMAKILPVRKVSSLTKMQRKTLRQTIRDIMVLAVNHRGTSFRNFVDGEGKKGGFQELLQVYGRGGLPCFTCGNLLEKGVVAQRGTVWCSACQK